MTRPNLVFLIADQLRAQSCGYMGDRLARTPNLDRLAVQGVNCTNAVSMHPVCSAYRASLFTGCYSSTTGMAINELCARTDLPALAQTLNGCGYESGYIGKWHLYATEAKSPINAGAFHHNPANQFVPPGANRMGFDSFWAAYNFNHEYYDGFYYGDTAQRCTLDGFEPDAVTDLALRYLSDAANHATPFDLFVSYGTPHQPWNTANVPQEWTAQFSAAEFPLPPNYADGSAEYWHAWFDRAWWQAHVKPHLPEWQRIYYAMTANLDWNVGRILAHLGALGLADSTVVVFTSDHGEMFGAHGRVQKNIFYDEAARVPFLVRWPGHIPAGLTADVCLNTPDIMPTLLSLFDLPVPDSVEGQDLSHWLCGKTGPEPEAAFLQGMGPSVDWDDGFEWRALRSKQYTYAVWRADGSELLFDNVSDPLQMTNLAHAAHAAPVLNRFRRLLAGRMTELGDEFQPVTWYRDRWVRDGSIICTGRNSRSAPKR